MAQYRRVVAARNETDFNECADMTVGHGIYTARLTGPTGKGNGMSGNAHLSQENRIGMGDKFKDLRKVENISIEGGGPQGKRRTIDKFSECNIDRRIIANLNEVGIREPTAVQRAVLPIMLNDTEHDLLAQAETGSGKTAAYLIPIVCHIQRMKNNGHLPKPNSPYSVIVAPTRELAGQIAHEARVISEGIGISVALSYGQMHMGECRKAIAAGCDILVATPGRLIGHYEERSVHFKSIRWIVLDEADQMFDYSLGQFVVPFLKESLKNSHGVRLFAFSATFTAGVICTMEKNYLKPDYYVVTGRAAPKDNIKQRFVECQRNQKKTFLLLLMNKILRKANRESRGPRVKIPKTIIFVDTKFETNYLAIYLTNLGISCISFNGDRTQLMREKAIDDFSRGHFSVMVCTNVCARGLNMKNVEYVINYDIPFKCQEMFLHRIGRTGRAGNVGTAYTFFERGRDEKNIEEITAMIEDCGIEVPDFIAKIKEERENRIVGCFHGNED